MIYGADDKVRSVKLLRGDAKYKPGVRKLELHSIKNLYPLEVNITHNQSIGSSNNDDLLKLDVVDCTSIDEPDATNVVEQGIDSNLDGTNLKFRFNLDQEISESLLEGSSSLNSFPDPVLDSVDSRVGTSSVSSRGRQIRRPNRPLDNQFDWGDT